MKLASVEIEGYRSIHAKMTLIVEPSVTVVLGPNDHGKTNLMNALEHLNGDRVFKPDDLNWDSADRGDSLPMVDAQFNLSSDEIDWLLKNETEARRSINRRIEERAAHRNADAEEGAEEEGKEDDEATTPPEPIAPAPSKVSATNVSARKTPPPQVEDEDDEEEDEDDGEDDEEDLPKVPIPDLDAAKIPLAIRLRRFGIKGGLEIVGLEAFQPDVRSDFKKYLPRVELIEPFTKLSDSVSAEELVEGKNEFMRGIFYYAGLDPNKCASLFEQNDRTQMTITEASQRLNATLRESWSQGKDLEFRLTHNSLEKKIELQIKDPSVKSTYVRASRRSSGFTHYFSLKTILNARSGFKTSLDPVF